MKLYCGTCKKEEDIKITDKIFSNRTKHTEARCAVCDRWLKFLPQDTPYTEITMPFGKHKGEKIINLDQDYLWWLLENNVVKGNLKKQIENLFTRLATRFSYADKGF